MQSEPASTPASTLAKDAPSHSRRLLALLTLGIAMLIALVVGELFVRWLLPQPVMSPRAQFSEAYGLIAFPNRSILSEMPGHWRFTHGTNALGHRGPLIPLSNRYPTPNVVVLGDSYTFGYGIDDGQEYPALLRTALAGRFEVVNLGMGGWGLTQEIRRFYELGQLYQPVAVVLQFTGNDPFENLSFPVTRIEQGRFSFHAAPGTLAWVKRLVSDSVIQRSQLYNLLRQQIYWAMATAGRTEGRSGANLPPGTAAAAASSASPAWATAEEMQLHGDLLALFARDLTRRGIPLILIGVEGHFDAMPPLLARVKALDGAGLLRYIDVASWLNQAEHANSPEGHWGPPTHRTVADGLAKAIDALGIRPTPP